MDCKDWSAHQSILDDAGPRPFRLHDKKKTFRAAEQDRPEVQEERQQFKEVMEVLPAEKLVFLDESGCNIAMTRAKGWAPSGERAHASRPVNHGGNITLVGAIRASGPVVLQRMRGAMNKERFITFVRRYLAPRLGVGDIVVLDNLRSHYALEAIEAIEERGAHVLFLPPYSPDMNPIEMVWSWVKNRLRRLAARTYETLMGAISSAWRHARSLSMPAFIQASGYGQSK